MKENGIANKSPLVFVGRCIKFKACERDQPAKDQGDHILFISKWEGRMYQGSEEIQINWGEMEQ